MLTDFLQAQRGRLLDEAQVLVPSSSYASEANERRARLGALLDELVVALHGATVEVRRSFRCDVRNDEGERLRRAVLSEVNERRVDISLAERAVLSDWSSAVELDYLRGETRRFSALLDALDDAVVLVSPDGRTLYQNRIAGLGAERVSGLQREQLIGKTTTEIGFSPELGRRVEELVERARRGEIVAEDLRVPGEADAGRWSELKLTPVSRADGQIAAVAVVGRDVHDRRVAEMRFRLLAKMSSLVGLGHDEMLESIAQLSIPEFADWGAVDLIEGQQVRRSFLAQRDPAKSALRDALLRFQPGPPAGADWVELRAGRSVLIADVTEARLRERAVDDHHYGLLKAVGLTSLVIAPIHSRGRLSALLSFATTVESGRRYGVDDVLLAEELARRAGQIVENARLQADLERSQERFRIALAAGRIAVYEQDANLRYRFSYNADLDVSTVGKRHQDVFGADDAVRLDALKRRALGGERVRDEIDLFVGGERHYYKQAIEPVRDASGAVVGLIGAATDVTSERRAQMELSQAVMFRERMIGILGHDLRNPLNAISMAIALMRRRSDLPDDFRAHALRIDHAARRMGELITTLLDFAQARFRGRLPVSLVRADLAEIVHETIEELRVAWPDRRIDVALRGDPRGMWDPARIAQVISNLVANALAHGASGAPVDLAIDGAGAEVTLTVHNDGPVIPPDLIATLFEPFRRGPDESKSRGLGLGLYIAGQIVAAHGGHVEVHSSLEDGTRFIVHLPRLVTGIGRPRESARTSRE